MSHFGQISAKEHYLLRMMLRLAPSFYTQKPVSLARISVDERISVKYLEQLVRPFAERGWFQGARGRDGGYVMTKDPSTVTLKDILWESEKNPATVECLGDTQTFCPLEYECISKNAWSRVQEALEHALDGIILSELIECNFPVGEKSLL